MNTIKKLFGSVRLPWWKLILFAVISGVYTGIVLCVPFLKDTSFTDIGVMYERWVLFAVIVVTNGKNRWDAALKCFVFFLISQPLVYATEVALGALSFEKACAYYLHIWLPATVLTLPGGLVAYFVKKRNWFGALVMGLGNTVQTVLGVYYASCAVRSFPHHLWSAVFCFASVGVMTLGIFEKKKERLIAVIVPAVLTVLIAVFAMETGRTFI